MLQQPSIEYDADPGSLYTVMVEDVDLNTPPPDGGPSPSFMHLIVTNVPGSDVERGDLIQVQYEYDNSV